MAFWVDLFFVGIDVKGYPILGENRTIVAYPFVGEWAEYPKLCGMVTLVNVYATSDDHMRLER